MCNQTHTSPQINRGIGLTNRTFRVSAAATPPEPYQEIIPSAGECIISAIDYRGSVPESGSKQVRKHPHRSVPCAFRVCQKSIASTADRLPPTIWQRIFRRKTEIRFWLFNLPGGDTAAEPFRSFVRVGFSVVGS